MPQLYYFAYGSNMNSKDLKEHCEKKGWVITLKNPQIAVLKDYELIFQGFSVNRKGGVASIIESVGNDVYGVLFEIDKNSLNDLNNKEGVGSKRYIRKNINVIIVENNTFEANETKMDVITYVNISKEKNYLPSKEYLRIIVEGAKEHSLPIDYIEKLETMKTND